MEVLLSNNAYSIGFPRNLKIGYIYVCKIFYLGTYSLMENSKYLHHRLKTWLVFVLKKK